ncbi:MAG: hypothetical protein ABIG55_06295 [Candidatus Omnitrophota bacterium]
MKVKIILLILISFAFVLGEAYPQTMIAVNIRVRGNTGREAELKKMIEEDLNAIEQVEVIPEKEKCHLYVDLSLVEQEPIRFYGLGVSIAYRIREDLYSRPTSDVAQFGYERMKDVCDRLVGEIDKAFLDPLKQPMGD